MGNRPDAEDVAQDAFLRIFRYLHRLDSRRDPTGWVVRITLRQCLDHLKRRRRSREQPTERDDWVSPEAGPADLLDQSQKREFLRRSLHLLAPRERAVFLLHEVDGVQAAGVARALRISRVTVRRHLMRARRKLRGHLREAGWQGP